MGRGEIKVTTWAVSFAVLLGYPAWATTGGSHRDAAVPPEPVQEASLIRSYTVDRNVSEFPPGRDLSTP
jgi:hypothetical protein